MELNNRVAKTVTQKLKYEGILSLMNINKSFSTHQKQNAVDTFKIFEMFFQVSWKSCNESWGFHF